MRAKTLMRVDVSDPATISSERGRNLTLVLPLLGKSLSCFGIPAQN
ncbi:MAG: hypothetical protein O4806_18935 [Trichodesmium sp. St5_bin8]|nr:hypothetical protein [Trichodesmium sp. St5_bin8]